MGFRHVLVTGGAGFIGSHLVDALLERPDRRVTVVDRLSHGGSRANLEHHEADQRFRFVHGDVGEPGFVGGLLEGVDAVVHAAAESHVDRSIDDPRPFFESNVLGTQAVLEAVRRAGVRLLMVSTDEVYGPGPAEGGRFDEDAPLRPRSPYAASKAAADLACQAYAATYGVDVTIVRGTNAYGPRQIERVVPTYAINALEGRPIPVYGRGRERREFLHVRDWVRAAILVLERGRPGVVYNIGDGHELENRELAERICDLAGADRSLITAVANRPGHDFRYGVRADRLRALGWRPQVGFDEGLARTVDWYRDHLAWLRAAHEVDVVTTPRGQGP
ncbi:MAG: dTDP-glucose 4,6-dehydratase [Actinomycetota bacterium]|jgi:dTDP-glucose 4,6-dehydratase|nr:MAG: dTDP-glucose 4,6-dehydratase [Actinomycetota bacterium]